MHVCSHIDLRKLVMRMSVMQPNDLCTHIHMQAHTHMKLTQICDEDECMLPDDLCTYIHMQTHTHYETYANLWWGWVHAAWQPHFHLSNKLLAWQCVGRPTRCIERTLYVCMHACMYVCMSRCRLSNILLAWQCAGRPKKCIKRTLYVCMYVCMHVRMYAYTCASTCA
jgi:hypothetical protein